MKIHEEFAEYIQDEAVRKRFVSRCAQVDSAFIKLAGLLTEEGFNVPLKSARDDARISIVVRGSPTADDWLRVQAFAAIARGEFDGDIEAVVQP